jgi:hypothetical protein
MNDYLSLRTWPLMPTTIYFYEFGDSISLIFAFFFKGYLTIVSLYQLLVLEIFTPNSQKCIFKRSGLSYLTIFVIKNFNYY